MSFDHLIIRDVEGERRVDAGQLPLKVGTGSDCTLRLPGPGGAPVALLDLLDGIPFVQPIGRDTASLRTSPGSGPSGSSVCSARLRATRWISCW